MPPVSNAVYRTGVLDMCLMSLVIVGTLALPGYPEKAA
jgi:hypothetical protein